MTEERKQALTVARAVCLLVFRNPSVRKYQRSVRICIGYRQALRMQSSPPHLAIQPGAGKNQRSVSAKWLELAAPPSQRRQGRRAAKGRAAVDTMREEG